MKFAEFEGVVESMVPEKVKVCLTPFTYILSLSLLVAPEPSKTVVI